MGAVLSFHGQFMLHFTYLWQHVRYVMIVLSKGENLAYAFYVPRSCGLWDSAFFEEGPMR